MARDGAHPGDRETPASPGNQESPSHSPFRLKTYIHAFSTIVLQPIDLYVCTAIMYLWSVKVGLEGIEVAKTILTKASGKDTKRPQLDLLMDLLRWLASVSSTCAHDFLSPLCPHGVHLFASSHCPVDRRSW